MIKDHLHCVINAIILKRPDVIAESVNSRVHKITAHACDHRNRERSCEAVNLHCSRTRLLSLLISTPGYPHGKLKTRFFAHVRLP